LDPIFKGCGTRPDTVAVPYFIHREDLKKLAPLWPGLIAKV
jgi:hypothetical protein